VLTAAHLVDFASQITRAAHQGFLLLLCFPLLTLMRGAGPAVRLLAWGMAGLGVLVAEGMLVAALPATDGIGFALVALFAAQHLLQRRVTA